MPAESTWEVPGYDICRLLGSGRAGPAWLAVAADSGALVVLRRGCTTPVVSGLAHVVRCLDACDVDGEVVLVMEHLPGGSLVGRRGQLSAGQVVTALAPIARAVARGHELGLVHGRVTASEVLLTAEGKPALDGVWLHGSATWRDDVRALADLGLELLAPDCGGPVRDALLAAEGGDADDLATALLAACLAEPLRPAAVEVPAASAGRRRRWPLAVVVLLAAVLAVSHGWRPDSSTSWVAVLRALDATRAEAFAQADPALLRRVYVAGSVALAEDAARLQALRIRQLRAHGLRHQLSVRAATAVGDTAHVDVIASLDAYEIKGPGVAHRVVSAGPPITQHVTLLRTRAGWLVAAVIT